MTRYRVTVRRRDEIVSLRFEWASSDKAKATEAFTREAQKFHGEDCEVEVNEY